MVVSSKGRKEGTRSSQIGNRFYFTFGGTVVTAVTDCSGVNVGRDLLGTTPVCSLSENILTIESNVTDASYVASSIMGISDIFTGTAETFEVVHGPPSLTGSAATEWDAGEVNKWEGVLIGGSTLTVDQWTWTKDSGPAITLTPNQSVQSYAAETLQLGGTYQLSLTVTFTNALWLTFTFQFPPIKMNFGILSNTQSGENFTILLSDSRVIINSCSDIFNAATVTSLGTEDPTTCEYDAASSTLQIKASADHSLILGGTLVYSNADLMSTTSSYTLLEPNIYIDSGTSSQIGNKFILKLSRKLDSSTSVSTCGDILTDSPSLGTDSSCTYTEASLTLTVYVGNGHAVVKDSKLCIDPTKASPAKVLTAADINCMTVLNDLPTITITVPTDGQGFALADPITISASTGNLTNVVSYTYVYETESGPSPYTFSTSNETSKAIPGDTLSGTYVFKVSLDIGDSGLFVPSDTVTVSISDGPEPLLKFIALDESTSSFRVYEYIEGSSTYEYNGSSMSYSGHRGCGNSAGIYIVPAFDDYARIYDLSSFSTPAVVISQSESSGFYQPCDFLDENTIIAATQNTDIFKYDVTDNYAQTRINDGEGSGFNTLMVTKDKNHILAADRGSIYIFSASGALEGISANTGSTGTAKDLEEVRTDIILIAQPYFIYLHDISDPSSTIIRKIFDASETEYWYTVIEVLQSGEGNVAIGGKDQANSKVNLQLFHIEDDNSTFTPIPDKYWAHDYPANLYVVTLKEIHVGLLLFAFKMNSHICTWEYAAVPHKDPTCFDITELREIYDLLSVP